MEQQASSSSTNSSHTSSMDQNSDGSKRRSSSRSIKRRKFDDELVEYGNASKDPAEALLKKSQHRSKTLSQSNYEGACSPSFIFPSPPATKREINSVIPGPKPSYFKSKKPNKPPSHSSSKDLGRWKPTDDLMLITAVIQTNDLRLVHIGTKFSCKFTLQEIQQRWYALLYEPTISQLAVNAMKNLSPDVIADIESKTLFSKDEENLLASVKSTTQPSLELFEDLLNKNSLIFHRARTPKILMSQWQLMKQYHLLDDQPLLPCPHVRKLGMSFADIEEVMQELDLSDPLDEALEEELFLTDRREKKEIRILEEEVKRWQALVDEVTGTTTQEFDDDTLAVLRGRVVRYLIRTREVTIGRTTKDHVVDVDLQLEGPAAKVSRQQGTIRLRDDGDFFIMNEGSHPIFIDGRPILTGNKHRLNDNSVVEISGLRFVFLINMDLISVIRQEAAKLNTCGVKP